LNLIFNDPAFSFQLLRTIGSSYYGGADIGECLSTAYRIKEGDFGSWYKEWYQTANRIRNYGEKCLAEHHNLSASQSYLRASSYYRTAEFFLHENPADPRIVASWQNSVDCFLKSSEHFSHSFESIEIPYEGTTLPAYFYKPIIPDVDNNKNTVPKSIKDSIHSSSSTSSSTSNPPKPRPTIIVHTGFDGTQEELYSQCVVAALQRGYNCLTFEGPGQGRVIRKQNIPFRYDWEKVVSPVIDYLFKRDEVDNDHLALMGISLGGYLAARAVAFEKRISACILDDGVFDVYRSFVRHMPKFLTDIVENNVESKAEVMDSSIEEAMGQNTGARWGYSHGMWVFGAASPFDLVRKTRDYTLKDIISEIKCNTLVLEAEEDDSFPGQPKMVYSHLSCPKEYMLFTKDEGAEDHCHVGALSLANQRIFDWLDKTFSYKV
jgi:pimeloyl-ACP methyl ester carboxylesterase